jgi:integrase
MRNPKGSIGVVSVRGRLKLRFPRPWFGGEQVFLSLGIPNTDTNRKYAEKLAKSLELEYLQGLFDWTLKKYEPDSAKPSGDITLSALWQQYCAYKAHKVKPSTLYYWVKAIGVHIDRCPVQSIPQALEVRNWLLRATTPEMAKRVIAAISTTVDWGLRLGLLTLLINPYMGMSADLGVEKSEPKPNALSINEKRRVIAAFDDNLYYHHYADLVRFWFSTGCRPSEGIGLEWTQINDACTQIKFDRSIVRVGNTVVRNRKSKTNKTRKFDCQPELTDLLLARKKYRSANDLVFPSPSGKPIHYCNFSRRAWDAVVDPILNRPSTPYSCRDTFICEQLSANKPIWLVAQWVDNSPKIIQSTYLDMSVMTDIRPI